MKLLLLKQSMDKATNFKLEDQSGLRISFVEYGNTSPEKPTITLLPMLHTADAAFYEETNYMLHSGDIVLFEGAEAAWPLRFASRIVRSFSRRFSLALESGSQEDSQEASEANDEWTRTDPYSPRERTEIFNLCNDDACKDHLQEIRFVWADLERSETHQFMKDISWVDKLKTFCLILAFPLMLPFVFKKDDRNELIDTLSRNWGTAGNKPLKTLFGGTTAYIVDARDAYLAKCLRRELDNPKNAGKRIIVKYGGGHMHKLDKILRGEYGFSIRSQQSILAIARKPKDQKVTPDKAYGSSKKLFHKISIQRMDECEKARLASIAETETKLRKSKREKRAIHTTYKTPLNLQDKAS